MSFHTLGLDPRLLRALGKLGLTNPTPVQASCIPKTLEGKDVIARARTGSGKTLAYLLPALHRILTAAGGDTSASGQRGSFNAIVLVPTRELCEQVRANPMASMHDAGQNRLSSLSALPPVSFQSPYAHVLIASSGSAGGLGSGRALRRGHLGTIVGGLSGFQR